MILADVNVLIYAFRSDSENHAEHKSWLERVVNGSAAYGISPQVLGAVVRMCMHPRIFAKPSSRADAFAFCLAALAIEPGCDWITTDRDYARFPGLSWRPPY